MTATAIEAPEQRGSRPVDRSHALGRLKPPDTGFRLMTHSVRLAGAGVAARRRDLAVDRLMARVQHLRLRLLRQRRLEPAQGAFRRRRGDLRHAGDVNHRDGDRRAGRSRRRGVPHRTLSARAAPPDRHRDRASRRHPLDHLRHLGRLLFQAGDAGLCPAVPHPYARRDPWRRPAVRRAAARLWRAHRRPGARDHDPAVRHRDFARRLRDSAHRC